MKHVVFAIFAASVLAGCATTGEPREGESTYQRLVRECDERGGILVPSGEMGPNEETNYVCEIRQGGGRVGQ